MAFLAFQNAWISSFQGETASSVKHLDKNRGKDYQVHICMLVTALMDVKNASLRKSKKDDIIAI